MMYEQIYKRLLASLSKFKKREIPYKEKVFKTEIIKAPKGAKYLSEFLPELPSNTFINKATTGVGATTMALRSDDKYIVAVPYQSLASNKKAWCELRKIDVLVVKQGVTKEEIANYDGSKILVVFDSLWKLTENLKDRKSFRLMVDEAHVVLTSATFRGKGMNMVLNHFRKFKNFVLVTATPTPELYGLDEFKKIKKVEIHWPDKEKINFIRDVVDFNDDYSVLDKLILISKKHIEKEIESNAYFFVNSISTINRVVKTLIKLKLVTSKDVNLIVAEGNSPRLKVNLGKSYTIGAPPTKSEKPKKLNFITSTAFEGSDFYDKNGKIYIISDGSKSHTKIDIQTQLHQIAGRIRDSKLNKSIQIITVPSSVNFFQPDRKAFKTKITLDYNDEENYLNAQKKIIKENSKDKALCERINTNLLSNAELSPFYIADSSGYVEMNKLYIPSQMHYWNVINQSYVYSINIDGEVEVTEGINCGVEFKDEKVKLPPKAIGKAMLSKEYNFRQMMILYIKARKEEGSANSQFVNGNYSGSDNMSVQIGKLEPRIPEAYRILKPKGIMNLNYSKTKILKAIDIKAPINNVAKHLKLKLKWYSNQEIKERLQKYYDKTSPNLKAKATDIYKYYVARNLKKRIAGKRVNGLEIVKRIRSEKK